MQATLEISGKDYSFKIIGEQERFPIPGSLDEIREWLRLNAIAPDYDRYFIPNGIVYLVDDENWRVYLDGGLVNKRVAFVFDDFRKGINNHVAFRVTYDPKAQYDVYKILWDMGGSSGAEWTKQVKEIWKQIPPPGYYEWVEAEIFPTLKGRERVWREGPPPGWTPRQPTSTTDTPQSNTTIIADNIYGNVQAGDNNHLTIGVDNPDSRSAKATNVQRVLLTENDKSEPWKSSRPNKRQRDETIWKMREAGETWEAIAEKAQCGVSTAKENYERMKQNTKKSG